MGKARLYLEKTAPQWQVVLLFVSLIVLYVVQPAWGWQEKTAQRTEQLAQIAKKLDILTESVDGVTRVVTEEVQSSRDRDSELREKLGRIEERVSALKEEFARKR